MPKPKSRSSASRAKGKARAPRKRSRGATAGTRAAERGMAGLAHEIRTALTGILALGELLATSDLGERERRWATSIKTTAEYLAQLTTLIVDGAKSGIKGIVLREDVFNPRRLVETVGAAFAARAESNGLTAEVAIAKSVPDQVVGDPVRLRAALENLADNAVKFTERGKVALSVAAEPAQGGTRLVFSVADSGIGMSAAEIKRLFRPFEQASDDVARRFGGAGLGLAFVKRLAGAMGGDLTVTSKPGRGSVFRLAVRVGKARRARSKNSSLRAPQKLRPLAILCAEDNPFGRVVLSTILTELGHRPDFVGSGEAAIAAVAAGRHDVVLMDITMPGLDGLEATRRIRALPGAAGGVPIIGISGRTESANEGVARAAGMNAYLTKPVSPSLLAQALAAVTAA